MGRVYTVPFSGTVTAAGTDTDLFEIAPTDDKPCRLLGFTLGQTSEVGDAAEEGLRISVVRLSGTITSGSGGSSVTPVPLDSADAAAGFTAEAGNTTVATQSGGATTILEELAWNERMSPYEHWYPSPECCPKVKQSEMLLVRMQTTVNDNVDFAGTAWIVED
jgi:hypothetical protein